MKISTLVFLVLSFLPSILKGQQAEYVSPAGTKFLLYTPPSYATASSTYPLLVSLHGRGEMGNDITKLTSANTTQMPSRLIYLNRWPADRPFIVLTPQYTQANLSDPHPVWPVAHIDEVVNYVLANYRVDLERIYFTGLSMGAFATWRYAAAYPNKVTAMIPISGRNDMSLACLIKDIPTWAFHGDSDPTVNVNYSIDFVKAITNCQPQGMFKPKLNILYTKLHNGWNEIYNESNQYKIYDWFLKFTKGSTTNVTPYVNAGPDLTFNLTSPEIHIIGDAFDSDGIITNLAWKQTLGTPLVLSDTNTEVLTVRNLVAGTFEFELSATDNSGGKTSNRVIIKIVNTTSLPVVNNLVLMNGATNLDVTNITDGMVIDKNALGLNEVNIKALVSSNTRSIKFSIGTNRATRIVSYPGPYLIMPQASTPEWQIQTGEYLVCATPYTSTSGGGTQGVSKCYVIKVTEGTPIAGCEGAGKIFREIWAGVAGSTVASIPVSTPPTVQSPLYSFESPTNVGDNYGARIRGYICPPVSGNYTFWISSDDRSELWLSTNDDPSNKRRIAYINGYTGVRQWTKYASQQSIPIALQAATKYYIEALHKESAGGDHLAVGWQLPNGIFERPIPALRVMPFDITTGGLKSNITILDDTFVNQDLMIYPNPLPRTERSIHLAGLTTTVAEIIKVQISSMKGDIVVSDEIEHPGDHSEMTISFKNELAPGVYVIYFTSQKRRVVKRFIVY